MKYSSDEFARMLRALSSDIVDAHIHWRLANDIGGALRDHPLVAAQSNTFWSLTHTAHVATALQCLARAYDQEDSSLHLPALLEAIRDNSSVFAVSEFRERLKDNPFVESLAEGATPPDPAILAVDIALCSATDPDVNLLVQYRNTRSAHRSRKLSIRAAKRQHTVLSDQVVQVLLDRAKLIFNRYVYLFSAEVYSTMIIGRDDYKFIFSSVEEKVMRLRAGHNA
jgi:hypothetical protein